MMNRNTRRSVVLVAACLLAAYAALSARPAACGTLTVQEQEPNYKYVTKPAANVFIQRTSSPNDLVSNATVGITQGVETNPLLDSSHKVDSYTQEMVDMHFKYPVFGSFLGFKNSNFGFNIVNTNYYKQTDVNTMYAVGDLSIDREIADKVTLSPGYVFEYMYFPNAEDGTFVGNQFNVSAKQSLRDWAYQKGAYRVIIRNYLSDKARLGDFSEANYNRFDVRNQFEHEFGVYIGNKTKFRITNQFYINKSNYAYFDFYNYYNYRFGASLIRLVTKKLYTITGFYYNRKNYMERHVSDRDAVERDNLYTVTTSVLYDLTKDLSIFVNYTHSENHSNEPLQQYVDTLYSAGFYYSF